VVGSIIVFSLRHPLFVRDSMRQWIHIPVASGSGRYRCLTL
jgi:hypothetical protein